MPRPRATESRARPAQLTIYSTPNTMQRLSNICGASSLRIIQQSSTVTPRLCLSSRFIPRPTTSSCRAFSRPMSSMFPGFVTEKMDRQQVAEQTVKNAIEKTTPLAVTNEQRWAIRSEEALKEAKKNPPANAYTGTSISVKFCSFLSSR